MGRPKLPESEKKIPETIRQIGRIPCGEWEIIQEGFRFSGERYFSRYATALLVAASKRRIKKGRAEMIKDKPSLAEASDGPSKARLLGRVTEKDWGIIHRGWKFSGEKYLTTFCADVLIKNANRLIKKNGNDVKPDQAQN